MRLKPTFAALTLGLLLSAPAVHASPTGVMVASYFSPASTAGAAYWAQMDWAAARVPLIAIMNPNSGPGSSASSSYVTVLARLHAAGGRVIGYVSSDYAGRQLADVKGDIDKYSTWYAVDGFFIDEMTNDSDTNHVSYYAAVYRYAKSKGGQYIITGNPGANTRRIYLDQPTADILMIYESGSDKYSGYNPSAWVTNFAPRHFAHLPYGVVGAPAMSNCVSSAIARNADWVYISDLTTYSKLPTYWTNEVNFLTTLNAAATNSVKPVKP